MLYALRCVGVKSSPILNNRYPYLLPNLVGAAFALLTLVLVVLYIPETNGYHAAAMERAACLQLSRYL